MQIMQSLAHLSEVIELNLWLRENVGSRACSMRYYRLLPLVPYHPTGGQWRSE